MKLLLFIHGYVGNKIYKYLRDHYINDIGLVVIIGDSPLEKMLVSDNIDYIKFDKQKLYGALTKYKFDLGLTVWWPHLLPAKIINTPKRGIINFHPSLLPFNRGKNANFWAIVENCPYGVTLHFIDEGVDSGDIIFQKIIPYKWTDTGETLYRRAEKELIALFVDNYENIRNSKYNRVQQELDSGSYHRTGEMEEASRIYLDEKYTARELLNKLRAKSFDGYPACIFEDENSEYEIKIRIQKKNDR